MRGELGKAWIVASHRHFAGQILEQVAGQPELREYDEIRSTTPGLVEERVVTGEVLVESAEPRRELGQSDPNGLH